MSEARNIISYLDRLTNFIMISAMVTMILYGGYALWDTYKVYNQASISSEIMHYKPTVEENEENPTLPELLTINEDVCAWITIDDTNIDYPVLKGSTNSEYLNKDIYGDYSLGGSIFLDCDNSDDFTDLYSLIYGHHMDGGAMFGDVVEFEDAEFFNDHLTGWLFTMDKTYKLEIYAYLHVDAYSSPMFNMVSDEEGYMERLSYIMENAVNYREIELTSEESIVALSTCSSATTNGRSIVVAKMVEYEGEGGE